MRSCSRFLIACLGTVLAGNLLTPAARADVSVLYAPTDADSPTFRSALHNFVGGPVDYFNARAATPTLDQLLEYGCVMTWVDWPYADRVAMGNVLADYVDAGGRVILGQWCRHSDQNNYLAGRIMSDPAYCPVLACSTSIGNGSYKMDGGACPHNGPYGVVGAHSTQWLDVVSSLAPGAYVDGTIGSSRDAVWNPSTSVWYSPGNTGGSYGSGDWVKLTANMAGCTGGPGACCHISTSECIDDITHADCLAMGAGWQPHSGSLCAALSPPCGDPGACCDIHTGQCVDGVLEANCANEFHGGEQCAGLFPECGDPGCCCDSPESGEVTDPHFSYRANCRGRFVPDVPAEYCVPDLFWPECGLWIPTGMLYAPTNADAPAFRSALQALLDAPVDYLNTYMCTPSLDMLQQYKCVMTWVNYPYADAVAMGDVLADYVDLGGRVILGQWCYPTSGNHLDGRIMTAAYCPAIIGSGGGAYNHDGTDCVHDGVTDYTAYEVVVTLQPGCHSDGTVGSQGKSAVAWRGDRLVYYSCGNMGSTYDGGDWLQLTANMYTCVALRPGDMNCDGVVNVFDIDPFVLALTDQAVYVTTYSECDYMLADCNGDGYVNAFDIDAFVALLVGAE